MVSNVKIAIYKASVLLHSKCGRPRTAKALRGKPGMTLSGSHRRCSHLCPFPSLMPVTTTALHLELQSFGFSPSPWGKQLEFLLCFWCMLNNEAFPGLTRVKLHFEAFLCCVKYPDVECWWWLSVQSFSPYRFHKWFFICFLSILK